MTDSREKFAVSASPWPHRLAVMLACATFPLLCVGGLVTTYDAGMAVPDWPNTYGYNLFLYPLETWLAGPFNLFVEHGHRLLGATVGLITIALVIAVWLRDDRLWMRFAVTTAFALVCAQGALGGMRVLLDDRTLARTHACVGPLFFAVAVALSMFTSPRWKTSATTDNPSAPRIRRLSLLVVALAYLQIVAGAFLRHFPVAGDYRDFRLAVLVHLLLAVTLAAHVVWLAVATGRQARGALVARRALWLAGLTTIQLVLGAATYVLKYNWPEWFAGYAFAADVVVQRRALLPALITTAHVAVGSLILVTGVATALWSMRLFRPAILPGPGFFATRHREVAA